MKKFFSISLSFLMMTAMLHLSVATHYCGGKEIAMKVSLTGQLAGCGMEGLEKDMPLLPGTNYTKHCCEDILSYCGISSDYTPAYSFLSESYHYNFQVLAIPSELSVKTQPDNNSFYSNISPPGALMSTNVDLSNICVFRI